MSWEIVGSAVLEPGEYPLLALHRQLPQLTLPDLKRAAAKPGRIRRAALHVARCRRLGLDANVLCKAGAVLAARIPRLRRRA